jgi:hypothetical protein
MAGSQPVPASFFSAALARLAFLSAVLQEDLSSVAHRRVLFVLAALAPTLDLGEDPPVVQANGMCGESGPSPRRAASVTAISADVVEALAQAFERCRVRHGHATLDDVNNDLGNLPFGQLDDESARPVEAPAHAL